ncbi:hypothetical protein QEJ31_14465 [Pigmentibacter sp. JX0631]|uniref:hypothetical protein n=1 Tax=Pigmentibacter sp. JX0631 TaxID=2976982 RepID=UPI0024696700|nr:hypothetical protein [Pigmentibacter sp. JX0631]WGL59733.1 hypothetical protein QEJ31_14465 [Pigmentibacter sp. JX0631]
MFHYQVSIKFKNLLHYSLFFLVMLISIITFGKAYSEEIIWEQIQIPAPDTNEKGLETLLIYPNLPGKHPVVLITHGTPRDHSEIPKRTAMGFFKQAMFFAKKGFSVAVVMRSGFGHSGGNIAKYSKFSCQSPAYLVTTKQAVNDLQAALGYLSTLPQFDTNNTIAVGVSTGGLAVVGLTAFPLETNMVQIKLAISFAGGSGSFAPRKICGGDYTLISAFKELGKSSSIPMLWIYAENDQYFSPDLANELLMVFNKNGGNAKLIITSPFGEDGHFLFNQGMKIWEPIVEKFFQENNYKLKNIMLTKQQENLNLYPNLSSTKGKEVFMQYLDDAPHKAFAVGDKGSYGKSTSQYSKEEAITKALEVCKKFNKSECKIIHSH